MATDPKPEPNGGEQPAPNGEPAKKKRVAEATEPEAQSREKRKKRREDEELLRDAGWLAVFVTAMAGAAWVCLQQHWVPVPASVPTWYAANRWALVVLGCLFFGAAVAWALFRNDLGRAIAALTLLLLAAAVAGVALGGNGGWLFCVGAALTLGVVWCLLAVRNVVRRRRLQIVVYLSELLFDAHDEDGSPIEMASLRLALEKYLFESDSWFVEQGEEHIKWLEERRRDAVLLCELNGEENRAKKQALQQTIRYRDLTVLIQRARDYVESQGRFKQEMCAFVNWLPSYVPFVFLSGFFFIQIAPAGMDLLTGVGLCPQCGVHGWSVYWRADHPGATPAALVIATFAFSGAYLHALTDFASGVVSYQIGATSFLRAFRHMIAAISVAVVSWYAVNAVQITFPSVDLTGAPAPAPVPATHTGSQLPVAYLVLAFVIGIYPDLGLAEIVRRSRLFGLKQRGEALAQQVRSTPLELLDGIDYDTRLRMEEFGIVDVQNLATFNPILLFAETPSFGLDQSIDWIAQAQLCLAVGPDCYVKFKDWRVRTIFDLERALLACETPDYFRVAVAKAIFDEPERGASIKRDLKLEDGNDADACRTAMALGRMMMDDLHVQRLRQIWKIVQQLLGYPWSNALFKEDCSCAEDKPDKPDEQKQPVGAAAVDAKQERKEEARSESPSSVGAPPQGGEAPAVKKADPLPAADDKSASGA